MNTAPIRQLVADIDASQTDTERFTALLSDDVVIVNLAGTRVRGRDQLSQAMARALDTRLAQVLTRSEIRAITFVRSDVAIVSCVKHIRDENADASDDMPAQGSLTFVAVDEGDAWRIALAQTTPIMG